MNFYDSFAQLFQIEKKKMYSFGIFKSSFEEIYR